MAAAVSGRLFHMHVPAIGNERSGLQYSEEASSRYEVTKTDIGEQCCLHASEVSQISTQTLCIVKFAK